MATIKVGAATETELEEKKARVEDAMHATKAAVEEGIVPVGGVALLGAAKALQNLAVVGDEQLGVKIIARAIDEPMRWIAANAGHESLIVVQRVTEMTDEEGFNAESLSKRAPSTTRPAPDAKATLTTLTHDATPIRAASRSIDSSIVECCI